MKYLLPQRTIFAVCQYFLMSIIVLSCNSSENQFEKAKKLLDDEKFEDAIPVLTAIIEAQPDFDSAYLERGFAYQATGNYEDAMKDYQHLMSRKDFVIPALYARSVLYSYMDEFEKAIQDADRILKMDRNNASAYFSRGFARMHIRKVGMLPDTSRFYLSYMTEDGRSYYKDYKSALADFDKAIELDPGYPDVYVERGKLFADLGDLKQALVNFNDAIKLDSRFYNAFIERAQIYKRLQEPKKAMEDLEKAVTIALDNPLAYFARGYLKRDHFHDQEGACEDFRKAIELGGVLTSSEKAYCDL